MWSFNSVEINWIYNKEIKEKVLEFRHVLDDKSHEEIYNVAIIDKELDYNMITWK